MAQFTVKHQSRLVSARSNFSPLVMPLLLGLIFCMYSAQTRWWMIGRMIPLMTDTFTIPKDQHSLLFALTILIE